MPRRQLDYSVYLVTGREFLPAGKDYYESLEESLQGGVTLVQVREKNADTGEFIEVARRTKQICDKYNVPVLINDRIDVHLAVGTAGIHIGQTDCPLPLARTLIGPDAIIGLSVRNVDECKRAIEQSADYIGIGSVWHTSSKDIKGRRCLGPDGTGEILDLLDGTGVKAVAIGGIHLPNLPQLLHGSISPKTSNTLDGVAVISDIVASQRPRESASQLREIVDSFKRARLNLKGQKGVFSIIDAVDQAALDKEYLVKKVEGLMRILEQETPLINQLTNKVVMNDSANVTLAVGASPIMSTNPRDVYDLSPAIGACLINFGTIDDKEGMKVAGRQANVNRKPLIFDPVAVGATSFRRENAAELLAHWQPTIIKGNAAEIGALAESTEVASRGVDAAGSGFKDPAAVVKALARKRAAIIVLTGPTDYISDGDRVYKVSNGSHFLEKITGSGCQAGTLIACFAAASRISYLQNNEPFEDDSQLVQGDMLVAALAGILVYTVASEAAAERSDVKGPGTFRSALIDELYNLTPEVVRHRAKVEIL
ncbi:hydroxyethylthiazole kinase [Kwoniella dejecticola CBS 10117]|uniref:Hydroxyethylthiazole kinase n=1 Tax=Kwoniella dejecticola CBS 10117 TaxID=1296121 RepID=A0A1A5ZYZ3_9TREE|nr:hydroxyethylthiazole kinase [Kwoniella dejecticola CBS 10117]OBR83031.1 hydroxyethylthiazole kinase [Kwoniella dejecticola CBS 10117]